MCQAHLGGSLTNVMKTSFDVIMKFNWTSFHVLYDDGYPQTDVLELVNRFSTVREGLNKELVTLDVATSKMVYPENITYVYVCNSDKLAAMN